MSNIEGQKPTEADLEKYGITKNGEPDTKTGAISLATAGKLLTKRCVEIIERNIEKTFLPLEVQETLNKAPKDTTPTSALTPSELRNNSVTELPLPGETQFIELSDTEPPDEELEEELNSLDTDGNITLYEEDIAA